jgi:hypothetical protein
MPGHRKSQYKIIDMREGWDWVFDDHRLLSSNWTLRISISGLYKSINREICNSESQKPSLFSGYGGTPVENPG